ncbi:MAG: mannitol dehydrogenase family protein [Eubacteriales bacterium]|nr:mannitol dehydrogenase family protein [Eubacteriales bacterium]
MKLNLDSLKNNEVLYKEKNVKLPQFDVKKMREKTAVNPTWLHFGAGNIFRGYIALLQQSLLDEGIAETGIIAADSFDYEIIDCVYHAYDELSLFVGLKPDGNCEKQVVGSISESLKADSGDAKAFARLIEIAKAPSLQMMSFTITEKGYQLFDMKGNAFPVVVEDEKNGIENPKHACAMVASLLYHRFENGAAPIAIVSMDNCSHNGEKIRESVLHFAKVWRENSLVDQAFVDYVADETKVAFPWSMIDKITPRPDASIQKSLEEDGFEDMAPFTTGKNTFIAPYVNAEIPQYLVIEDKFPNGRPALEKAGVYFTDRDTVNCTERMKVTTCLNPIHTALAVTGCLLGYHKIADEMKDADLKALAECVGMKEGLPMVVSPKIIDPAAFIKEVLEERLPNPFIPDMPQRIATDTSQKVGIRFGETIKAYEKVNRQQELKAIPFAIAAWLRYLLGKDDNWVTMEISSDPMLEVLQKDLSTIKLGESNPNLDGVREILSNDKLFGTNLVANGMSTLIEEYFVKMLAKEGAVRETLQEAVGSIQ